MSALGRKIASGLYGRLEFDFACERGHAFSEYYVHGVVNELVAARVDPAKEIIHAGYALPAIQSGPGRGRPRELDFAVTSRASGGVKACIEVKWAESSHADEERVARDICRLALAKRAHPGADCLFVLAGGKTKVRKLLDTGVLAQTTLPSGAVRSGLLSYPYSSTARSFRTDSRLPAQLRQKLMEGVPKIPQSIPTYLCKPSHADTPDWMVLVWRVG